MPNMRRVALLLTTVFCLLLTSCSCEPPVAASTVLDAMYEAGGEFSNGMVRVRGVSFDSPLYLTDSLLSAMYGEAARGWLDAADGDTPLINDAALFLSTAPIPYELAVFRCSDVRGTMTAAAICRARLDTVRRAWQGSEWSDKLANAVVVVEGEFVLLVAAADVDVILAAARHTIKRGGA